MTIKELTDIATSNTLAAAENNKAIAQLTNALFTLHESVKTLAVTVASHDDSIEEFRMEMKNLSREWQAYIKTLPKT